ncbi:MAG: thioredoxin domain-containing protein, partial [Myxococcales bacterium]|nr:thioredoxin domain-containing protein [Myxococcales bacterium]
FEKMLYDNAQLVCDYALAGALLDRPDFLRTAANAGDYLLRDMRVTDEHGALIGYASAEDADDPGGEGAFYAWSPDAIAAVFPDEDEADALITAWDLADGEPEMGPSGHWEPVAEFIPHPRGAVEGGALGRGELAQRLRAAWEERLPVLREVRDQRPRPGRDDKVLTDLNGLALRAFAVLGRLHGGARFVDAARELAACLEARFTPAGLERMAGRPAFVTDYGHLALGYTEAYLLLGDPGLVDLARRCVDEACERLQAPDGGFFTTPAGRGDLIRRSREQTDGAYPAGQHALAFAAARLHAITGDPRYGALVDQVARVQANFVLRAPTAMPTLLRAVLEKDAEAVVVVSPGEVADALLARARGAVRAGLAVVPTLGHVDRDWPILEGRLELDGAQALVCVGTRCLLPARAPEELDARLA